MVCSQCAAARVPAPIDAVEGTNTQVPRRLGQHSGDRSVGGFCSLHQEGFGVPSLLDLPDRALPPEVLDYCLQQSNGLPMRLPWPLHLRRHMAGHCLDVPGFPVGGVSTARSHRHPLASKFLEGQTCQGTPSHSGRAHQQVRRLGLVQGRPRA